MTPRVPYHIGHAHRRYLLTCQDFDDLYRYAYGRCQICLTPGCRTAWRMLVVDHDAPKGRNAVRGLLCNPCNSKLGSSDAFRAWPPAAAYLSEIPWFLRVGIEKARPGPVA